jgi:hypothetical protein
MVKIPGALDGRRLLGLMRDRLVSQSQHWRFFEPLPPLPLLSILQFAISLDILPRKHLQILMKIEHPSLIMHPFILATPLSQIFFLLINPVPHLTSPTHIPLHLISDCLLPIPLNPPIKIT